MKWQHGVMVFAGLMRAMDGVGCGHGIALLNGMKAVMVAEVVFFACFFA